MEITMHYRAGLISVIGLSLAAFQSPPAVQDPGKAASGDDLRLHAVARIDAAAGDSRTVALTLLVVNGSDRDINIATAHAPSRSSEYSRFLILRDGVLTNQAVGLAESNPVEPYTTLKAGALRQETFLLTNLSRGEYDIVGVLVYNIGIAPHSKRAVVPIPHTRFRID